MSTNLLVDAMSVDAMSVDTEFVGAEFVDAMFRDVAGATMADLARITEAVDAEPWGDVARAVDRHVRTVPADGVTALLRRALRRSRAQAERSERAEVAAEIAALIAATGLTVAEVAAGIGTSRSRLSTYRSGRVVPAATVLVRLRRLAVTPTPS